MRLTSWSAFWFSLSIMMCAIAACSAHRDSVPDDRGTPKPQDMDGMYYNYPHEIYEPMSRKDEAKIDHFVRIEMRDIGPMVRYCKSHPHGTFTYHGRDAGIAWFTGNNIKCVQVVLIEH